MKLLDSGLKREVEAETLSVHIQILLFWRIVKHNSKRFNSVECLNFSTGPGKLKRNLMNRSVFYELDAQSNRLFKLARFEIFKTLIEFQAVLQAFKNFD